jgi:hypothetical protein
MTKHAEPGLLEEFITARTVARPIPLKRTDYAIAIEGGLAVVTVTRLFRNDEGDPIEATMTFPVPFEAVVTNLVTKVGARTLTGKAAAKAQARETYEDAIDRGKAAVLHEELLRGLHMISVANVAPGAEIEVAATFVMPFSQADGSWNLRIPVTVGQVYGQIPLPESDAVLTGGPVDTARLSVSTSSGTVLVRGRTLVDGRTSVALDRPIDLELVGVDLTPLQGRAAHGSAVTLTLTPAASGAAALNAEVLVDVSGSMLEPASADDEAPVSKWDVVRAGLIAAARQRFTARDQIGLWTFSNACRRIGRVTGDKLEDLVRTCSFDNGGTELPTAITTVTASRREANVLLVTDGKSWGQIDVQAALATGARFTVVLVGEDALEVNVGYLAAMSGGQMFVVRGGDADLALLAAVGAMRGVASPVVPVTGAPKVVGRTIGGVRIEAEWAEAGTDTPAREGIAANVAAYAASLALAGMSKDEAAALAEDEGLVTHLTSIVLVDEAGAAVEGIPATRKIALAAPASAHLRAAVLAAPMPNLAAMSVPTSQQVMPARRRLSLLARSIASPTSLAAGKRGDDLPVGDDVDDALARLTRRIGRIAAGPQARTGAVSVDVRLVAQQLAWDRDANSLVAGSLPSQLPAARSAIAKIAALQEVVKLAQSLGRTPDAVAVAIIAKAAGSRTAMRVARAILVGAEPGLVAAAEKAAGL